MDFFDSLSPTAQIVALFVGIAILFLLAFSNNKRNKGKLYDRKRRSFRDNYYDKKKDSHH
jgi:hypothetical protein